MSGGGRETNSSSQRRFQRYKHMVNAMQEAACIYDRDGCFELVNEYLADFYGTTRTELEGRQSRLIPQVQADFDGDPYEGLWEREREEIKGEIEGEYPGRGRTVLEYRLTPLIIDGEVDGIVGVARDITERKQHEKQLQRQNDRLNQFASVVSHDLRNPLTVARGNLELAQEECDSSHLDGVSTAHERMEALIDDLLTLARQGYNVGDTEPVDLKSLVEECWQVVSTSDVTLSVETTRTIQADRPRLRQLLENLIRNAVEHGGKDVTVTLGDCANGFYVADDGEGLPDVDPAELFQLGHSTTDDGTGFGLGIVQSIVDGHGWEITASTSSDGGARFEITDVEIQ